ncbi:hypothetical protein ACLOJK_008613 [Asimina triloba]
MVVNRHHSALPNPYGPITHYLVALHVSTHFEMVVNKHSSRVVYTPRLLQKEKQPALSSMENPSMPLDKDNPSIIQTSPNTSNTSSSGSGSSSNGIPLAPKTITRADNAPYPTTFIQADTSSFKHVVQMLTGSSETTSKQPSKPLDPSKTSIPPIKTGPKKPAFKLYERRNSSLKSFKISPLMPGFHAAGCNSPTTFSPRKPPEILSPSTLDFPSLVLSPVTPLIPDPFNRPMVMLDSSGVAAEERAIAEKGFYLHPSPITTPRDCEPQLLPLFPTTSPRVASDSSS